MCEPTTIGYIALALTAAGGLYQVDATRKAGQAQVEMAQRNEATDRQRADLANRIGSVQEDRHRAQVRSMLGTQRANLAANGIDPDSGTALALQDETVGFGETDAMTIRYNAAREAWGFGVSANNERTQAAVARSATKNAVRGTYLTTAASMFSMGASMGGGAAAGAGSSTQTLASGMTYTAPATSSGASWLNAYGAR